MSRVLRLPANYVSSPTNHESAVVYKPRPRNLNKIQRNSKKSSFMRLSSSTRNISHNGTDLENIEQEMQIINKEIKIKKKELESIKKVHDKVEEENLIVLNILDSLLTECQEIEEPLEKRAKDIDNKDNKTQILINKFKKKYELFKKELSHKEAVLRKLKENERTVRLYELDDKIKETKKNLSQVKRDQEGYMSQINNINKETNKINEELKNIISQNNLLKKEKLDYINKTKVLLKENKDLDSKKAILEGKVSSLETNVEQLKNSIEKKNNEISSLKSDERIYNELNKQKIKYDKEITDQMKNIVSLNEQINKQNRQIKDDEKMISGFKNHIGLLNEKEIELKSEDNKLEELKNKRNEKQSILDEIKKLNELIIKYKVRRYDKSELTKEKIVSFNLNFPIKLEKLE
jgi:chromosome segregation ATPase